MKKILLALLLAAAGILYAEQPLYSIPVLGDLHYDRADCHDMEWVTANMGKDLRQIRNYTGVTETNTPELFRQVEANAASRSEPVPFVIQMGDFTEGLCGSRELQGKLFRHALDAVKGTFRRPFFLVRGNHDVTGPGSWEAGDDVLLPYLRETLNDPRASYNYAVERGEDVFLFFEAMRPDLAWLKRELPKHSGKRHIFLYPHIGRSAHHRVLENAPQILCALVLGQLCNVGSVNYYSAAVHRVNARYHIEHGRFSRAVSAYNGDKIAVVKG